MIEGIGVDLIEIRRIKKLLSRQPNFVKRILTTKEEKYFKELSEHRQIEFLAGRFAAKEAFSKAFGTGIGGDFSFLDIEILPNSNNRPIVETQKYPGTIHLSISHSDEFAVAQIILERVDDWFKTNKIRRSDEGATNVW